MLLLAFVAAAAPRGRRLETIADMVSHCFLLLLLLLRLECPALFYTSNTSDPLCLLIGTRSLICSSNISDLYTWSVDCPAQSHF